MIASVLLLAGLAVVAVLLLVLPLLRTAASPGRARYDTAVYRDQLAEVERDLARGLIGEAEARSARLEIERRLLAVAAAAPEATVTARRSPVLAAGLALLVAGGAAGLYFRLGAPGLPDTSYAARVSARGSASPAAHPDMAKLAAELGDKLRADPNNAEAWRLYARTLASLGNWQASADAYRGLVALGAASADDDGAYGEMLVLSAEGAVTPAAREAFASSLRADPSSAIARFYLALADAQAGRGRQALDAWVKLAGEVEDPGMRAEIARRMAETARLSGLPAPAMPPLPGQEQADMPDAQRAAMVDSMVAQLAAKLAAAPNDADGWARLGRAYAVLERRAEAVDAYEHAVALRPDDATVLVQAAQALIEAQRPDAPIPKHALDLLRRAERIDPRRPEALWYLGLAAAQAGDAAAAGDDWRRLLEILPADSPDRKLVSDAIGALK